MFEIKEFYAKTDLIFALRCSTQIKLRKLGLHKILRVIFIGAGVMLTLFALVGTWGLITAIASALTEHIPLVVPAIFRAAAEYILAFCAGIILLTNLQPLYALIVLSGWRKLPYKDVEVRFVFDDRHFTNIVPQSENWPQSETHCEYPFITDICEDQMRFLLIGRNIVHMLRKDSFTQGDPEQFREFIQQKTGKTVEYVK